ncbi:hypothetical protein [Rothia dentocariosa]|uniref:hypothetical protein n=1 Tax=Rothia dentocariosa TaxID=2047 RepID=UPI00195EEE83|nr:hypothetical protein [Rothia dentocariosa]VTY12797.1 Uncharacterised protein [Rothia dentocariosa]
MDKIKRIPNYIKYSSKNTRDGVGLFNALFYSMDNWDRVLKVGGAVFAFWGVVNIFLWGLIITSFDFHATLFLVSKEGFGGGLVKLLPSTILIGIYLLVIFGIWKSIGLDVYTSNRFIRSSSSLRIKIMKLYVQSFIVSLMLISVLYIILWSLRFNVLNIYYFLIYALMIISSTAYIGSLLMISNRIFKRKIRNHQDVIYKKYLGFKLSRWFFVSVLIFSFFVGIPSIEYSGGYGTGCMRVSGINFSDKSSDIYHGSKGYSGSQVLSYYSYDEDRDNINIVILDSYREEESKSGSWVSSEGLMGEKRNSLAVVPKKNIVELTQDSSKCFKSYGR